MLTLLSMLSGVSDCVLFLVPVQVLTFKNSCTEMHGEFQFLVAKQKRVTHLRDLSEDLAPSLHF